MEKLSNYLWLNLIFDASLVRYILKELTCCLFLWVLAETYFKGLPNRIQNYTRTRPCIKIEEKKLRHELKIIWV